MIAGVVVLRAVHVLAWVISAVAVAVSQAGAATADSESNGRHYTVTMSSIEGSTADTAGHWQVQAGQLSGGDPQVAAAFNTASTASAGYQIDQGRDDGGAGRGWTLTSTAKLTFRPTAIAQVMAGVFYAKGAAHPLNYVSTVVIDSRTATPITLADLFADEQAGLNRLSQQTKKIGIGTGPMSDEPGNAPVEQNFANWIPTAQGLELHFTDYQFVHGTPVITVGWAALTDVLAPDMRVLAGG